MAKDKNYFLFFTKWYDDIKSLSDDQIGTIFRALCEYKEGNEISFENQLLGIVFNQIRTQIQSMEEADEESRRIKQEAGRKGGNARVSNHQMDGRHLQEDITNAQIGFKQSQAEPSKVKQTQAEGKQNQADASRGQAEPSINKNINIINKERYKEKEKREMVEKEKEKGEISTTTERDLTPEEASGAYIKKIKKICEDFKRNIRLQNWCAMKMTDLETACGYVDRFEEWETTKMTHIQSINPKWISAGYKEWFESAIFRKDVEEHLVASITAEANKKQKMQQGMKQSDKDWETLKEQTKDIDF